MPSQTNILLLLLFELSLHNIYLRVIVMLFGYERGFSGCKKMCNLVSEKIDGYDFKRSIKKFDKNLIEFLVIVRVFC